MKCVICQHLNRCSVVMMRLLFLSDELNRLLGYRKGVYWGLKVKRIKYHSQGSEKGDTLPVFWCPSSTAPPSRRICKDKRVMTIMHLDQQNLDTAAHKCTTNTHFIQYLYTFSKDNCARRLTVRYCTTNTYKRVIQITC